MLGYWMPVTGFWISGCQHPETSNMLNGMKPDGSIGQLYVFVVVAITSVSAKAIKASLENPVKSLGSE